MRRFVASMCAALLVACSESSVPSDTSPDLATAAMTPVRVDLGALGGVNGAAMDINASGVVVGGAEDANQVFHAFIWDAQNGMRALGELPGDFLSIAFANDDLGNVIGTSLSPLGVQTPVIWPLGGPPQPIGIQLPGVSGMTPIELNKRGEIVGSGNQGSQGVGFFWSAATGTIDLRQEIPTCGLNSPSAINDAGTVVGIYCFPGTGVNHGFIWKLGTPYQDVSLQGDHGLRMTGLSGINQAGLIIGSSGNPQRAMILKNGKITQLPTYSPNALLSLTEAINDLGQVVGSAVNPQTGNLQASFWSSTLRINNLNGADPNVSVAQGLNNAGVVVGTSFTSAGAFVATLWAPAGSGFLSSAPRPVAGASSSRLSECVRLAAGAKVEVARCVTAGSGVVVQ